MSVPPSSRTLGALLDEMAAARPEADAVVFRDQHLTYAMLRARVDEFARALIAVGVTRGDRVAVLVIALDDLLLEFGVFGHEVPSVEMEMTNDQR